MQDEEIYSESHSDSSHQSHGDHSHQSHGDQKYLGLRIELCHEPLMHRLLEMKEELERMNVMWRYVRNVVEREELYGDLEKIEKILEKYEESFLEVEIMKLLLRIINKRSVVY